MRTLLNTATTLFAVTMLMLLGTAQAQDQNADIDKILEGSGFNKLTDHIPQFSQVILKQSAGSLEPELSSKLSLAFTKAFASANILRDVKRTLQSHFDAKQANAYLAEMIENPLAIRMAELERTTSDPTKQADRQKYAADIKQTPPPASRMALIKRLDSANGASKFTLDLQAGFFQAVFTAIDPVLDTDMKLGEGEMEKMVTEVRQSLKDGIITDTELSYLYAFRELSDSELESYVVLCEGKGNRWATQLLANAMIGAINKAADRAAMIMHQAAR